MQQPRWRRNDRFAHLRDALDTYRAVTAPAVIAWCIGCGWHHAAEPGGLCPVCESDRDAQAA